MALGIIVWKLSPYFHNPVAVIKFAKKLPVKGLHIIWYILKPGFHMSGKSQTIGGFTVSQLFQILPTNENPKS